MADLGLLFYNARWYDPDLGRWAQADTYIPDPGNPADYDRYGYVRNNPYYHS
jgi:RHS repeat-associated protein